MKRKWSIVNDRSNSNYGLENEIIYDTEVLKSTLCGFSDGYILVITVIAAPATQVSFKNCAPFTKCIPKIYGNTIDDAEDLDLVMPMYNLVEYSSIYSQRTGSLWFYSKDEAANNNNDIENTDDFKSFEYQAKFLGNTYRSPCSKSS